MYWVVPCSRISFSVGVFEEVCSSSDWLASDLVWFPGGSYSSSVGEWWEAWARVVKTFVDGLHFVGSFACFACFACSAF